MTTILSWNIQSGLGCDGIRDLGRICDYIKDHKAPDIICLQEISCHIDEFSTSGQENQLDYLCRAFSGYSPHWASGGRWLNGRGNYEEFGNLTLAKVPVKQSKVHLLPKPASQGLPQLSRCASEVIIAVDQDMLRIINTHLAFHHQGERREQLDYFCQLHQREKAEQMKNCHIESGPYSHQICTLNTILCGDLNFTPESSDHDFLTHFGWKDGWILSPMYRRHPGTCGIYDDKTWPEGKHCRDYFWLSDTCNLLLTSINADEHINYSDHQPIFLTVNSI